LAASMGSIRMEREGLLPAGVVRLILDRPRQRNAVSAAMLAELASALGELAVDPGARVVILSGAGPDFCAGADFAELEAAREGTGAGAAEYGAHLDEVLAGIQANPLPVIAQVHGAALGAGCQLAVVCDLAVAAADARLGIPSARLGVVISYGNIERLVLAVGPKRAAEILYTGRVVSGEEGAAWGLVNRAVPEAELATVVEELAAQIAGAAPLSVRGSKRGIAVVLESLGLDPGAQGNRVMDFEMMAAEAFASQDLGEGIEAFRERRAPRFKGS
jgi:enoyl-CoA hydratase